MTSMLERPESAAAPRSSRQADVVGTLPVAGLTAGVWAAGVGLLVLGVVTSLLWAVSGRGEDGISTALRASGAVWLVAHHAALDTASGPVTLLPLALLAVPLLLLARAGRWAARITSTTEVPDAALLVVTGTTVYAAVGFLVAQGAGLGDATVSPIAALGWCALVAAAGLGLGVADGAGMRTRLVARIPLLLRRASLAAAASAATLLALAALVTLVAIATRWSTVTGLSRATAPAVADAVGVVLLSLAYLPNLVVWALSYVCGPGFVVGDGLGVDPFSATGGLLPGLPVLGAIPPTAPVLAPLLLLLPVAAGMLGSVVLRRRGGLALVDEALALLGAAGLVGAGAAVLAWLSRGGLGDGRLASLGPHPLAVGLACAGLVAAGALLWSLTAYALPRLWVRDEA